MLRCVPILMLTLSGLLVAIPVFAEDSSANEHYQEAVEAQQSGDYNKALELLELAYRAEPQPRFIHRRILVLEHMGEYQLALDVLDDYREQLVDAPGVKNLAVLEQRLRQQLAEARRESADETDLLGASLVGGGGALVVGGVASLLYAEAEADRLRCSRYSSAEKFDCDGVDAYGQLDSEQFDEKRSNVTTLRVVGAGLSAVGIGALGWGLYRLAGSEAPAQVSSAAATPEVHATFDALGRMRVELEWRF